VRNLLLATITLTTALRAAPTPVTVSSQGETKLYVIEQGVEIDVRLYTREVDIGAPTRERPSQIRSNCTYSKAPCSLLEGLTISVNQHQVLIPRSVYGALSDVSTAVVRREKQERVLILRCGDASESIIVKIWFDGDAVLRRDVYSALDDSSPIEHSVYRYAVME
jgi:hypothetical protein